MKLKKFSEYVNENSNTLKSLLAQADIPTDKETAIDQIGSSIQLYKLGLSDARLDLIDVEIVHTGRRLGLEQEDWRRFLANIKQYGVVHESTFGVSEFTTKPTPPSTQLYAEMFTLPLSAFFVFQEEIRSLANGNEENFEGPKMIGAPTKRDVSWNHWLSKVI